LKAELTIVERVSSKTYQSTKPEYGLRCAHWRVQGEVVDGRVALEGKCGDVDEVVNIEYVEGARGINGDEVEGKEEVGRSIEREGGDGGKCWWRELRKEVVERP